MAASTNSPAKVTRPSVAGLLRRERLHALLDRARGGRCVWVSAPGGAGKTSLINAWLDTLPGHRVVWYQVDAGDGDPATLFHYLGIAATWQAGKRAGLPRLTPECLPTFEIFARRFFEAFFAKFKAPLALVFDNYQEVPQDSPFHAAVAGALSALPTGSLLACLSREEPPPFFARWSADAGFHRIGWDALRLTDEEAAALATGAHVDADELRAMNARARGWAAGLRLLLGARALGDTVDAEGDTTTHTFFGYFANEVFRRMPPAVQDVLLETSLLPHVTAEWARKLTGRAEAGETLAKLHRERLFIDRRALRGHAASYEFHPLFREFLEDRIKRERSSDQIASLRRRAASLLESAGETAEAASLWAAVEDWSALARLAREQAPVLLREGRTATLESWILTVPQSVRALDAPLLRWLGVCHSFRDPALARQDFEQAYRLARDDDDRIGAFLALGGLLRSFFLEWGTNAGIDRWIGEFEELLAAGGGVIPAAAEVEVLVSCLGLAFRQPDHPLLVPLADRAEQLARSLLDADQRLSVSAFAGQCFIWTGQLVRARALSEEIVASAALASVPSRCEFAMWRGVLAWQEADFEAARRAFAEEFEISKASGVHIHDGRPTWREPGRPCSRVMPTARRGPSRRPTRFGRGWVTSSGSTGDSRASPSFSCKVVPGRR